MTAARRDRWRTVQVPHDARRDCDWATCICGWQTGGDDYDRIDAEVAEHNRAHEGELVTMWEFR